MKKRDFPLFLGSLLIFLQLSEKNRVKMEQFLRPILNQKLISSYFPLNIECLNIQGKI